MAGEVREAVGSGGDLVGEEGGHQVEQLAQEDGGPDGQHGLAGHDDLDGVRVKLGNFWRLYFFSSRITNLRTYVE